MSKQEIGNESIFIGKSAEERQQQRDKLATKRLNNLNSIKRITEKLRDKTKAR